jgi:hypothetical protein
MRRNAEFLKRSKCKFRDQNRINWCTYKNFSYMYYGIYKSLVKAGVAIITPEDRMYNKSGNCVLNEDKMFGFPAKQKIIKPEK